MIDSHAHYSHFKFDNTYRFLDYTEGGFEVSEGNRAAVFEAARKAVITAIVELAIDMDSNYKVLDLCHTYPSFVYRAVGLHPTRTQTCPWVRRKELDALACANDVVALGETGLDYHHKRKDQHRLCQRAWFLYQLRMHR